MTIRITRAVGRIGGSNRAPDGHLPEDAAQKSSAERARIFKFDAEALMNRERTVTT